MIGASPKAVAARGRLEAADVRLRGSGVYAWTRRAVLAGSVAMVLLVPLLQLRALDCEGAGLAGGGFWAQLAASLHLPCADPRWVGAPWAVRVLGVEMIDPLAAAGLLVARAGSLDLLIRAALPLALVVLLGRFFCGWLCPYLPILAVSNALRALLAKLGRRAPDLPLPRHSAKWILGALLAITALTGSQAAPLLYPPSLIAREAFRAIFFGTVGGGALVVALAFAFDTFVSRAGFCRYLCPGGAMFSLLGARSPVRVVREPARCTDCTLCDVVCNLLQQPMSDRVGAGCERCGRCVAACPTDALRMSSGRSRLPVLGSDGRRA